MKRVTQFVMSLVFGGIVLYSLLWHFNLQQTMASVRQARPGLLMLGVALIVVGYLVRGAWRRIWERSLSYWDSLLLILIGFMGNNLLPARLGEMPAGALCRGKNDRRPWPHHRLGIHRGRASS